MSTLVGAARHQLHPILFVCPLGFWVFSLIADVTYAITHSTVWLAVAYYAIVTGIIWALAAVPGSIDFLSTTRGQLRKTRARHLLINLTVLLLFAINLWHRSYTREHTIALLALSAIGISLLAVSGWLGGELMYRRDIDVAKRQ